MENITQLGLAEKKVTRYARRLSVALKADDEQYIQYCSARLDTALEELELAQEATK